MLYAFMSNLPLAFHYSALSTVYRAQHMNITIPLHKYTSLPHVLFLQNISPFNSQINLAIVCRVLTRSSQALHVIVGFVLGVEKQKREYN